MADALTRSGWTFKAASTLKGFCVRFTPTAGPLAHVELAVWSHGERASIPDEIPVGDKGSYVYRESEGTLEWVPRQ